LENCIICPRRCNANRSGSLGYCRVGNNPEVASICIHKGEEPPVSGIFGLVNVFFSHCNLQCSYCQNKQISNNSVSGPGEYFTIEELVNSIQKTLTNQHQPVGFVSPTHFTKQVINIVVEMRKRGMNNTIVYNSNGYDSVDSIRLLEPYVDIYLPDYKYSDYSLAKQLSGAEDYPDVALKAIKEMYRQKGNQLITDEFGYASGGLIIRHLLLPGYIGNTKGVLSSIAWDISPNIHTSLMAQYNPVYYDGDDVNLKRTVTTAEYDAACDYFEEVGLHKGWIQSIDSIGHYNPDFKMSHPFEQEDS